MSYIDGFVTAVPTKNKDAYIKHAVEAAAMLKEYGALKLVECWGDDVPMGEKTSFVRAVQCKEDETVVFSWVIWPSREARNEGMKKLMDDPRMHDDSRPMPFDESRLIYGGFQMVVNE